MLKNLWRATALSLGLALTAVAPAYAQTWPTKPIKFIVPTPPGGSPDMISRLWPAKKQLGQPVIVDNRAAAVAVSA